MSAPRSVGVDTGVRRDVVTNASGAYTFPNLPPGRYKLSASAKGFRSLETPEFSLASIVDEGKGGTGATMHSINDCVAVPSDPDDPNAKLAPKPPPCTRNEANSTMTDTRKIW